MNFLRYHNNMTTIEEVIMINVVSFSGGRTSAYMTLEVLKIHPDAEVIYMDTGAEHPATYEFIRNFSREFDVKITCLRVVPDPRMRKPSTYEVLAVDEIGPDLEPWRRMVRKYGVPYVGGAFCTDRMKTVPFTKYCNEKYGRGNYERWLGIRVDEPKRLGNRGDRFHYLADISDFEKQDVLDWWREQKFDLGIQEHLGNCVFCIKKSLQKVALATKDEPELAGDFIDMIYGEQAHMKGHPKMYRNKMALPQVIALFGNTGRDELASRMRSMRQYDTGSCSESCEAFSGESNDNN
ncbi:MAG: phosphoadenosine phosphosulfate reductase [Bacteriophage sp.]|nr:MAG: phosphoadenosine phosphosulfate reductase [Bacteriophage sp.]